MNLKSKFKAKHLVGIASLSLFTASANAAQFAVTFENLQGTDGFSLTPAWIGFHDGTFDIFSPGSSADGRGIQTVAETGAIGDLSAEFEFAGFAASDEGVLAQPDGFAGAPVVEPGETATVIITTDNDFFSYASMIIPSNDTFIGNGNPMAFDVSGLTVGGSPLLFDVTQFWDAGTEFNDPTNGPAFSPDGGGAGAGADENGVVTESNLVDFNATFLESQAANGTVSTALTSPIAQFTITAVPEPSAVALFGMVGFGLVLRRRR